MKRLELLRQKLHLAISMGDTRKILKISRKLDKEILKFTRRTQYKEEN